MEAPKKAPTTIEFRTHLPAGTHNIRIMNAVPGPNPEDRRSRSSEVPNAFTGLRSRVPWQMKFTDDDGKPIVPFLLLDWVEWEGPVLASWPTPAYQQVFFGGEKATKDAAYARQIFARFGERAWRRPLRPAELDRLTALFEKSRGLGDGFEEAVKTALLAVLNAKGFLYLEEGSVANPSPRTRRLGAGVAAVVLPVEFDARPAAVRPGPRGTLHRPDVLRAEVRRMLADPKSAAFADSFPRQWLQLRKVGMFAPDRTLYPEYDEYLEKSMIAETTRYFREVLVRNAGIGEFLDSDWTMLNERLATHYGIAGVTGESMRRVALTPEDHRGGLLTQASILSLTSDGTRHRPVQRGVWVLESIVNRPPPPPPANVPALPTPSANTKKTTVREKLERHRADATSPAVTGGSTRWVWRSTTTTRSAAGGTVETVRDGTGGDPSDRRERRTDGRPEIHGRPGLKKLLLDDVDKFADAFLEKLATYALRRRMTFRDRAELRKLAEQSKPDGYKLATLVESLALSDLFRRR